ncbi:MAG TPA: hypothetical protein VHY59_08575 [Chthoniobacterales bacterium]|nr:hypothetical protein [Chthoniobacterales bacterium]
MIKDGLIALLTGANGASNQTPYLALQAAVVAISGDAVSKNVLPRGYTLPAIAVHSYGSTQENDMIGPNTIREDQIQLDMYGATSDQTDSLYEACRALLIGYVGTLPDGTVVLLCQLERGMDMPFLPNADTKGIANRAVLGFKIVSQR